MTDARSETGQDLTRLRTQLQRLRVTIAKLKDRSLDNVDSLLSVAQSELDHVIKDRLPH